MLFNNLPDKSLFNGLVKIIRFYAVRQHLSSWISFSQLQLLLLGTGDAGKSTFAKQLRVISNGFSKGEYDKFRVRTIYRYSLISVQVILRSNCLTSMQRILRDCVERLISFPPHLEARVNAVLDATELDEVIAGTLS